MTTWTVALAHPGLERREITIEGSHLELNSSGSLCFFAFADPTPYVAAVLVHAIAKGQWLSVVRNPEVAP